MKTIIKTFLLSLAVLPGAVSCISLDTPPYDRETDLTYWDEDPEAAYNAVNSCYNTIISMQEFLYGDSYTDNAYIKPQVYNPNSIANGSYSTDADYVESVWDSRYSGIRLCNELLTNIDRVPGLDPALKNRYIGEVKVIRAYHYYELYTRFGDVPYTEDVITIPESQTISRTARATVVSNILADLDEVIDNEYLPASYTADADKGRITKWAAMAVKARICLFESDWESVKDLTSKIMSEGGFSLFKDASNPANSYQALFEIENEGNPEVILDRQYMYPSFYHSDQSTFLPPTIGGTGSLLPLQELVDSYIMLDGRTIEEAGADYDENDPFSGRDPRLAATITDVNGSYLKADGTQQALDPALDGLNTQSTSTVTGYYFKKWWDRMYYNSNQSGLNPIVIRYADILLMNAEALAELGEFDANAWNATIRPVRERAGFTASSALDYQGETGDGLISVIRNERRCELAFENLRFKDIIRWKIAEDVMDGYCHGMKTGAVVGTDNGYVRVENRHFDPAKHYLWPVPQADRDLNPNLSQNPGW